jgi:hypothetical protein
MPFAVAAIPSEESGSPLLTDASFRLATTVRAITGMSARRSSLCSGN